MADYKGIKGFNVQSLATDPVAIGGVWSDSADLPSARHNAGGVGTATDALHFGGLPTSALTFSFNGTAWTAGGSMASNDHAMASFGITTAAVSATGESGVSGTNTSEEYNGTSWGSGGNVSTTRTQAAGFGTLTAGAIAGGFTGSPSTATEEYNGTSWTSGGNLTVGSYGGAAGGTQTAGIFALGQTAPGTTNSVHYYNGTAWTAQSGTANLARAGMHSTGAGTQTDFGIYGGGNPVTNSTEFWDGTSFTTGGNLPSARSSMSVGKSGTSTSAIIFGGSAPPSIATTNIYSVGGIGDTIKNEGQVYYNTATNLLKLTATVFGTGTWASGGAMNTANAGGQSLGGRDDNISCGPQGQVSTEQYNGTAWTALSSPSNMGEGRAEAGSAGTSTLGLVFGGYEPGTTAITELWNGSTWTELTNLSSARNENAGFGFGNSIFCAGGSSPRVLVEEWNGSSWSEKAEINTGRGNLGSAGTGADGLIFGGRTGTTFYAVTESWDGTSWTETGDLGTARNYGAAGGATSASSMYAGGNTPGQTANTETFNGTTWTEVNNLSTARTSGKGAPNGSANSMIFAGGSPSNTATEEWNAPSSISNVTVASS